MKNWNRWVQGTLILVSFLLFRIFVNYGSGSGPAGPSSFFRVPRVERQQNLDASLSIPLLDKVNEYWMVKGETQIRNMGNIRLTSRGQSGQYGMIVSNGAGDNILDDFETIIHFNIYNKNNPTRGNYLMGDGMAVMITPEKDFVSYNHLSSYARKQYEHNSGGIMYNDRDLMGLPRNLPGLAVVVDTYRNDAKTKINPPFMTVLLNMDPQKHHYSLATDGKESTGHLLMGPHRLKNSLMSGKDVKLRIIYLESIGFLKIDIRYHGSDEWIELYQKDKNLYLPKNKRTGERYIAISALTGQLSETVEIQRVETSEFHWDGHTDEEFNYAEEMQFFLAHEFGERIGIQESEYSSWKLAKSQGRTNLDLPSQKKSSSSKSHFVMKWVCIIVFLYGLSLSVRITLKRMRKVRTKKYAVSILG
ncbi:LANO_0G05710g1_1 [Lachancea nothofagi CBS 11611]|uniref:LANO_0G05710g1_1 n=1 Tax=Lachancea nothofagi CBS 11611 TaxID=1266666 RepID=A0A1G4KGR1_9SACH|nr:LANO_0G05710g1_1 [Lachancea nothofagi CBS 11611]